jgi:hypothetical protein
MVDGEAATIASLADARRWSAAAADLLRNLGFSLINSDRPGSVAGAHLLVALRAAPTLEHFDPDLVRFYEPGAERARLVEIDRRGPAEVVERRVLWGHVHVVDRLGVENRFLSFGGPLRSALLGDDLTVLDLRSPGPIVRWGGHSQGADSLAGSIGAFFGRLIVHVDFDPGAEARLAAAPPAVLYAAFLIDAAARRPRLGDAGLPPSGAPRWIATEGARVRRSEPEDWAGGTRLLEALALRG